MCFIVKVRLYVSFYNEQNSARRHEILECLRLNSNCGIIDEVCLLIEGKAVLPGRNSRWVFRQFNHRPTYADFFGWANQRLTSGSDVTIIANSDIYFDGSLEALCSVLRPAQCAALARWDVLPNKQAKLFDRNDSQDAWVFRGEIRPLGCGYQVGVPRCDNRLLHELRVVGYHVINPAFSVYAYHLHLGDRMEYPEVIAGPHVEGPYEYLWPHNLLSLPATWAHRVRYPQANLGWRFDKRLFARTPPVRAFKKACNLMNKHQVFS